MLNVKLSFLFFLIFFQLTLHFRQQSRSKNVEVSPNVFWLNSGMESMSSPETLPEESVGSRTPSPTFSGTSSVDSGFESVELEEAAAKAELHDAAKSAPVEGKRHKEGGRPKSPTELRKEFQRNWKQCELCDRPCSFGTFGKHMANLHLARFCRTCREYLPIQEEEEHKRLHAEPSYKGKKIR